MERKSDRRGLGRGLSALMADINLDSAPADTGAAAAGRPKRDMMPVEKLEANPAQPRRRFSDDDLRDLADSIRLKGVLQPLIVRPMAGRDGIFEIVAGERRWRAAQIAQVHEVPVVVRDFDDGEVLEVAIIENIQRADLDPIEEALAFRQLMDRFGHTQEKLAEALSKSRSYIANLLRLLALPDEVREMVSDGRLSAGHARALITVQDPIEMARRVVERGLSVRETEAMVRALSDRPEPVKRARSAVANQEVDADTRALQHDLSANLNMSVTIRHEPGGEVGILSIRYNTLEDLDFLCQALSVAKRDMF